MNSITEDLKKQFEHEYNDMFTRAMMWYVKDIELIKKLNFDQCFDVHVKRDTFLGHLVTTGFEHPIYIAAKERYVLENLNKASAFIKKGIS